MKMSTFTSVIKKVAKNVGRQHNIRVIFRGKQASTDKHTIILPAIPPGTVLTQREEDEFFGLLDHEIAHVKYSDFDVKYSDFDVVQSVNDRFSAHILNVLEDPRVENLFIQEYPGSQYGLDLVCEKVEKEFREDLQKNGEDLGNLTLEKVVTLIYEEAYASRGRTPIRSETLASFPSLVDVMRHTADGCRSRNTGEVKVHSDKIVEILKKMFPKEFKNPPPNNPQTMTQEMKDALQMLQWLVGLDSKGASFVGQLLEENKIEVKAILKELQDSGASLRGRAGDQILPPCGTDQDRIFTYGREDMDKYTSYVNDIGHEINALKRGLRIFLQSRAKKNYDRGLEAGRLDSDAVWKIRAGEHSKIFKEKRTTEMVDTSLQMMLDLSGSMDEELAATTGILVYEALMGIAKLKLAIAGFTTNDNVYMGPGGRVNGLNIPMFKSFSDSGPKVKARLGGLRTSNYTPLGEAMAYGFEALLARKESKRVLWMITDGQPTFPIRDAGHNDYLLMRKVRDNCRRAGITVVIVCVGISTASMDPYCDITVGVKTIADLPSAVLELVKELVTVRVV